MTRETLTTFEAARYLGMAPRTVKLWFEAGHLPGFKTIGGHRRLWKADLEAFAKRGGYIREEAEPNF